jgi:hypothetical protein
VPGPDLPDRAPRWLDEISFTPGPPHVELGTRRIDEADWLLVDDRRADELGQKADLITRRRTDVVAVDSTRPSEASQAATLALVQNWLADHRRDALPRTGATTRDPPAAAHAHRAPDLERAAGLVQEDLCLMEVHNGPPVLVAAVVCFPSYWRLADKIGQSMAAIHAPVPNYEETLQDRPDRLLEGLEGDRIVARRNWFVHDGPALFSPARSPSPALTVERVPERLWLRSERQTLRRLPGRDHVLFTIRVQQTPIRSLRERPAVAARMAEAVRAEAPERLDRIAGSEVAPLLQWLDLAATPA